MHNLDRAKFLLVRNADDSLFAPLGAPQEPAADCQGSRHRDFFLSPEEVLLLGLTHPLVDD